ncbi:hypothetical protein HQQ80_11085 [Microbacteriaceae bacterium VKM Ac-2855]|nr:hypothetical protein [Microbacteriaceae bacterium VKM Ac-2855]
MTAIGTLLFLVLGLAGLLAFSAVMKWRDPRGSLAAVTGFGIPTRYAGHVAVGLPFVELGLAAGLLLLPGVLFAVVAWLVFLLFAAFSLVVGAALARGERPVCHCFGELSSEPISRLTAVRNVVLTVLALVIAIVLGTPSWPGLFGILATLSGDLLVEVVLLVTLAVTLAVLWSRQARLRRELADLRARVNAREAAAPDAEAIPELVLRDAEGAAITLPTLSSERAVLLLFVNPGCHACAVALERMPAWRAELGGIVGLQLVSTTSDDLGMPDVLFDPHRAALTRLGGTGTPSAVLLGTNGQIGGGPADGLPAIEEFIDGVVAAIELNRESHTAMPGDPETEDPVLPTFDATPATTQAAWDDAELPSAALATEAGDAVDLRESVARTGAGRKALVFWRSDCAYCESILPEVRDASAAGSTVLVTTSEPDSVRAQGLTGPLYVSPDRAALAAMQVPGTPVGFLVDGHHVVAGPFIGADAVRELVARP